MSEVELIRKRLGREDIGAQPAYWLDTGEPRLHRVLGHREKGIPYGRVIEVGGEYSAGKSVLGLDLIAWAQRDKAKTALLDFEKSFDPAWAETRGVNIDKLPVFSYYVRGRDKSGRRSLITAEGLCDEIEEWIMIQTAKRMLVVVDSVAAMMTSEEKNKESDDQNMRTKLSVAMMMSTLSRRWMAVAASTNTTFLFINQIRTKPGVMFGNPEYMPGGKGLKFAASIRAQMRRLGGTITKDGETVGIRGTLTNIKNKTGGVEGDSVGYRIMLDGGIEFCSKKEIKAEKAKARRGEE